MIPQVVVDAHAQAKRKWASALRLAEDSRKTLDRRIKEADELSVEVGYWDEVVARLQQRPLYLANDAPTPEGWATCIRCLDRGPKGEPCQRCSR